MSTVEQHNEQLVAQKQQLQAAVEHFARMVGILALNHGKSKAKGQYEYRLTKSQREGFNKRVMFRELKTGGLVIEVSDPEEDE